MQHFMPALRHRFRQSSYFASFPATSRARERPLYWLYSPYLGGSPPEFMGFWWVFVWNIPTWWLIPRLVSVLEPRWLKWINPTYPSYNWGCNPLTSRGMSHQVGYKVNRDSLGKLFFFPRLTMGVDLKPWGLSHVMGWTAGKSPLKTAVYMGFLRAMFDYQRVFAANDMMMW